MGRRKGDGRAKALVAVRSLLARLSDLLGSEQANGEGPRYDSWEDAETAYLEAHLPGLGGGEIDIAVAGDKVFVRVAIDRQT
jgi:HSP20 family molecular chaperone IbpA